MKSGISFDFIVFLRSLMKLPIIERNCHCKGLISASNTVALYCDDDFKRKIYWDKLNWIKNYVSKNNKIGKIKKWNVGKDRFNSKLTKLNKKLTHILSYYDILNHIVKIMAYLVIILTV